MFMKQKTEGLRWLLNKRWSLFRLLFYSTLLLNLLTAGIYLYQPRFLEILNLKISDLILASATTHALESPVVTVAIDDKSLEKYGQWPWPRYRIAQLLEEINQGGPKTIGVDVIFAERDRTSLLLQQKNLADNFGYVLDTSGIPTEVLDPDKYLAGVLAKKPVVLGYTFYFNDSISPVTPCTLHPLSLHRRQFTDRENLAAAFPQAEGVLCNYEVLEKAASSSGFLNVHPDTDGLIRRLPLIIAYDGKFYPSFTLAALLQYRHHVGPLTLSAGELISHLEFGSLAIPVSRQGDFRLGPFRTEPSAAYSAIDILSGKISGELFKDKIVLVGLTATGLARQYSTPLAQASSSLDIHRSALESLTAGQHTIRTYLFAYWEILLTLLISLLLAGIIAHFSTVPALLFGLLSCCLSWYAAVFIYQHSGYLFSPLMPIKLAVLSTALLLIIKFYYMQQKARAETGNTALLLQSSETNLQSILKTIPDIVFRLDADGNITFIGPAISKYLQSPDALLGRSIFELVAPEDQAKVHYHLQERRTGKRATNDMEIRLLLTRESSESPAAMRYFSLSTQGIYNAQETGPNHFLGTQGIVKDITDRKRLEQQLLQAQKMEVIGKLAAGIAHDLNNILSGIVSYPDLLLMEIPEDDPLHKKIQVIQKSGRKAAVIVQDLLTLARRNITINETCNLNTIITDYLYSAEFQLLKERHPQTDISTTLPENLPNVQGSAAHLSKVIMNVLHNALEAMPIGGKIVITTAEASFVTAFSGYENIPPGNYIRTTVSDNGVGIAAGDLIRIFEPFYTKKSMRFSGTGLGMTVIWATIKDHNGYIDIESKEGEGTTFTFYLPVSDESQVDLRDRVVLDDYLGQETILVVDDIQEQLDIAKNMLTRLGYTVYTALNGEQALQNIKEQPVNLVILDMLMPEGLDGLATYQEIIKVYPHQKALITSGFSESKRVKKLLRLGAGDYIQKPYTMEKLGVAVRRELDRKTVH